MRSFSSKVSVLTFLVLSMLTTVNAQLNDLDSISFTQQLIRIEQQCLDDIPFGITTTYDKYMHPQCLIVVEDGRQLDKKAFLADFRPLPKGFNGYIKLINPRTTFHNNVAIIRYIADEYENVFESHIHTIYNVTNTYLKTDTSWQMISSTVFEIPSLPPSISVSSAILKKYVGNYQLADSIKCTVSLLKDTLYYQRSGKEKTALFAETENLFFRIGDARGRKLFIRDEKGTMLIRERRNGQDVVWKRIDK